VALDNNRFICGLDEGGEEVVVKSGKTSQTSAERGKFTDNRDNDDDDEDKDDE